MPERELTHASQLEDIQNWIVSKKGAIIANSGPLPFDRVYRVDGEPIVIYSTSLPSTTPHILLCSDRHAQELEGTGVISFSKEPQQGTTTP